MECKAKAHVAQKKAEEEAKRKAEETISSSDDDDDAAHDFCHVCNCPRGRALNFGCWKCNKAAEEKRQAEVLKQQAEAEEEAQRKAEEVSDE